MLLAGSALFLATTEERWVNRAVRGALLFCSGLPLTLAAVAWTGRRGLLDLLLPAFLAAQAMMLAGFFQFAGTGYATTPHPAAAPFLRGFYRAGIALPLVVGMGLGFWGWPGSGQLGAPTATAAAMLATAAFVWGKRRIGPLNPSQTHWRPRIVDRLLLAMWHEVGRLQNVLRRAVMTITRTLEGEAGILWSLVVLVLFVSLIADRAR
jgi:hypothetical protein